jgi:hypothetical protein
MSGDLTSRQGSSSAVATRPDEDRAFASSAMATSFAEARQDVEEATVRTLFGAHGSADARGGRGDRAADGSSAPLAQYADASQTAERAAVRPMSADGHLEPELTGTGFTYRHDWGPRRGQWTLRLNWPAVNAGSRVLVSVGEGVAGGPDAGKFIGAARYTVHNVAPRAGGVDIWVNVEWSADISLYVDYLVVNP